MKTILQRTAMGLFLLAFVATMLPITSAEDMRAPAMRGDCSFLNNQDILGNHYQHIRELSGLTEQVSGELYATITPQAKVPNRNFIDEEIFGKMKRDKIKAAPVTTDEEFMRRVTLDLTGRIPTIDQVKKFVNDDAPDKRDTLINDLIGSPEFVDRWTMFYGDLLQNIAFANNFTRYPQGRNAYHAMIREAVQKNQPYNQFVTSLITATGNNFQNGAVNNILGAATPMGPGQDTLDTAVVQTTTRFLGMETFDCLLCHDGQGHLNALNLWGTNAKRVEAWGMSAFFARTGNRRNVVSERPQVVSFDIFDVNTGAYALNTTAGNRTPRQPVNGERFITPKYIFTGETPAAGESYRAALARFITKDRQFARATVNYLWAEFFGLGIVDPPTNFDLARLDAKNPPPAPWTLQPSHPELLEKLATEFINSGYNLQRIMKLITQSSAYQLSSRYKEGKWKEEYTTYFARKLVRRLDAEEIHDALVRATGVPAEIQVFGFSQPFQFAMQLPDTVEPIPYQDLRLSANSLASRAFLNTFERGNRDNVPRRSEPTIVQSLTQMNSAFINQRLRVSSTNGTISRLLGSTNSDKELIDSLFLTVLGRKATKEELDTVSPLLKSDRRQGAEDLMWVLLNKVEFIYNY